MNIFHPPKLAGRRIWPHLRFFGMASVLGGWILLSSAIAQVPSFKSFNPADFVIANFKISINTTNHPNASGVTNIVLTAQYWKANAEGGISNTVGPVRITSNTRLDGGLYFAATAPSMAINFTNGGRNSAIGPWTVNNQSGITLYATNGSGDLVPVGDFTGTNFDWAGPAYGNGRGITNIAGPHVDFSAGGNITFVTNGNNVTVSTAGLGEATNVFVIAGTNVMVTTNGAGTWTLSGLTDTNVVTIIARSITNGIGIIRGTNTVIYTNGNNVFVSATTDTNVVIVLAESITNGIGIIQGSNTFIFTNANNVTVNSRTDTNVINILATNVVLNNVSLVNTSVVLSLFGYVTNIVTTNSNTGITNLFLATKAGSNVLTTTNGFEVTVNGKTDTNVVISIAETITNGATGSLNGGGTAKVIPMWTSATVLGNSSITNTTASMIEMADATTPMTNYIYGTLTDSTHFERMFLGYDSGYFDIFTQKGSAGGSTRSLSFGVADSRKWVIDNNGGLYPAANNTQVFGGGVNQINLAWINQVQFADGSGGSPNLSWANASIFGNGTAIAFVSTLTEYAQIDGNGLGLVQSSGGVPALHWPLAAMSATINSPAAATYQFGTNGSGNNNATPNQFSRVGASTGTGVGGAMIFAVCTNASATSSTVNGFSNRLAIGSSGIITNMGLYQLQNPTITLNTWFTNDTATYGSASRAIFLFVISHSSGVTASVDVEVLVADQGTAANTWDYGAPIGEPANLTGTFTNTLEIPIGPNNRFCITNRSAAGATVSVVKTARIGM